MQKYLTDLNEYQQEAAVNYNGASLIIAGAGSGKTRVLTYRIAHMLNCGVNPRSILALTFTNKASKEMKERIRKLIGSDIANYLWMGTFHSVFAKILRFEAASIGYTSQFTIYDTDDSKSLIKTIVKEMHLDKDTYKPNEIYNRISGAKNNLITPEVYCATNEYKEFDRMTKKPELGRIYQIYVARCKKADAMDFDDILVNMNILLRNFPEVMIKYQKKFSYILVDEYQDTNYSQYLIIKKLAAINKNICVVGDDAQSIYAFRGAKIENILNFKNDYPDYMLYKLEQNYRSTQNIVLAANSLIKKNKEQIPKKLFSDNEEGEKIKILKSMSDTDESYQVVGALLDNIYQNKFDYSDYAILYRTNAQSRSLEEALRKRNLPYRIYGGISFYQRKEIKDVLAYFRLAINNKDEEALKRVINYPARGIGDTTIEKLIAGATAADVSLWNVLLNPAEYGVSLNSGTQTKLTNFAGLIKSFSARLQELDAYRLAMQIVAEAGIMKELKEDKSPESVSRSENIEELINGINEFVDLFNEEEGMPGLDAYMQNIALLTDMDTDKPEDKNRISLMTVHAAKGLEFKCVFIVGVEENLFPSSMSNTTSKEIEEERRLFYVALTRAEKFAYISFALSRFKWGQFTNSSPSRFLKDIDPNYLDNNFIDEDDGFEEDDLNDIEASPVKFFKQKKFQAREKKPFPVQTPQLSNKFSRVKNTEESISSENEIVETDDVTGIQSGMSVYHERFGPGKVLQLEGKFPNTKATIFFQSSGQKQLLLKFAKLKIIE
ncbi:MAG: ATP-dependent DNA helicase [Bacteroidetes bacterium RIFOXYA12_FULL_35_11]|nr:MAG: ATP-dependent DNA helicase [Bacteroidetes bacterium GWF2_35_48]OFY73010.1 MAG: ATP-dependent DNA helicase [Bacteroidetes bacterium RIFOXYA12_FULL_35_11]OFY96547.1 MAG: ATP-dependent DNA helicase [Bacteroidetes bacterium RIFOXYB2_FULL_35_7]OFZ05117.1 MAG: ATP-dependent DNA helicase [Bacteroidetes bacterium RIFOXYC12_FULL_35_7]HBX49487.1 ATP-dependent DNA helicase [Bacteroidales bacterium]